MKFLIFSISIAFFIRLPNTPNMQVTAQESKTVYIEIFANMQQPPLFYELMDRVESKLDTYGLSLSVIPDLPDLEETFEQSLEVGVYNQAKSVSIMFRASKLYRLPKSPILYPDEVSPQCCKAGLSSVLLNAFSIDDDSIDDIAGFIAGLGLIQAGDYVGCEQELGNAYVALPESSIGNSVDFVQRYINFYRANCAIMRDDLKLAVEILESSKPVLRGAAAINLAWTYLQLGEIDKALELIMNLETGKDWDFLARRAQLYNLIFRYNDAITDLTTAIELSPAEPELYTLRGQTYLLLYEWDAVLTDYNKALELDPTYADAYYYRGVLYYSILQTGQEMYTAALADFQCYLELAPEGEHAAEATRYAAGIQTQINALNN